MSEKQLITKLSKVGNPITLLKMFKDVRGIIANHQNDFPKTDSNDAIYLKISKQFYLLEGKTVKITDEILSGNIVIITNEGLEELKSFLGLYVSDNLDTVFKELRRAKNIKNYKLIFEKIDKEFSTNIPVSKWAIVDQNIVFYSKTMTKLIETVLLESSDLLELVPVISEFTEIIDQPKVSIVVPVYNAERYVGQTLSSLANQTMKELEFIIVNDGSKDSSIDIINYFAQKDSRFKVIDKENAGVAVAINTGNKIAKGDYLAELDSDDYVAIDMYQKMYVLAEKNNVDILKSNVINFTGIGDTYIGVTQKIANEGYFNRVIDPADEPDIFSFPMYAWVSLYKRELIIDNDILWNAGVSSYNDNGFFWQTMGLATRIMYVDEDFIYHRRDNELSTVKDPEKMESNFFSEHAFIMEDAKRRGTWENIKPYFFERKINNYFFALNVIPYEVKQEFFRKIALDFKPDIECEGLNNISFLNYNNKQKINEIVNDPDQYFYQVYVPEYYKVSVVVPIHNAEQFLKGTIESLINQSLKQIEIILIENGSTDGTVDIIKEYAAKDARIIWESIGKSNAGHARNVGLSKAHGKYTLFLDADDEYSKELLKLTFEEGESKKADVVWFNTQEKNSKTGLYKHHTHAFRKSQMPVKRPFSFSEIKNNPYDALVGWPWDKLFNTKYIKGNGWQYQELEVANDGYFNFIAMSNARRIATVDRILVTRIVGHGNNISSNKHDLNPDAQL